MQQRFLLQILLLAQHVSGTIMPIIRSSRVLYSGCCLWHLVLWFLRCWSGVELRVMCPVCRMLQPTTNLSVFVTQTLTPALIYWESDANRVRFWAFGSVAYWGECKMLCSMSHGSVTVSSTPQLYSQHFSRLPICIKMLHSQYYLVVTVIPIPSIHRQTYVYVHIFFTVWRR